jgi:hypothetical protein
MRHLPEPVVNHSPWRKLAGQKSPSAAAPQDVKDSVEHMAQTMYLWSSALVGRPKVGLDALPFGIGKIGWVSPTNEKKRMSSLSRTD